MTYQFAREPKSGIILLDVELDNFHEMKMALDTGASHTTFDINALLLAGFPIGNITEKGLVETANGLVKVDIFKVESLTALGHIVCNVKVQVYDFLAHGIISGYDGVLGLDFFENTEFSINMKNQTIEIKS